MTQRYGRLLDPTSVFRVGRDSLRIIYPTCHPLCIMQCLVIVSHVRCGECFGEILYTEVFTWADCEKKLDRRLGQPTSGSHLITVSIGALQHATGWL